MAGCYEMLDEATRRGLEAAWDDLCAKARAIDGLYRLASENPAVKGALAGTPALDAAVSTLTGFVVGAESGYAGEGACAREFELTCAERLDGEPSAEQAAALAAELARDMRTVGAEVSRLAAEAAENLERALDTLAGARDLARKAAGL